MTEHGTNPANLGRGVLYPGLTATKIRLARPEPDPQLAPFVENHWIVAWDLRGGKPYESRTLPHPSVHLVFEEPHPSVYGIVRGPFVREIAELGHVFGVKFHPGGFRPFLGGPVADLADRIVPAADVFGAEVSDVQQAVLGTRDDAEMTRYVEDFLLGLLPARDPVAEEVTAMVQTITETPAFVRVDDFAAHAGISVRRLQRLFAEYVGASPKWVLRRARLHEAAERADQGGALDWSALAAELGYADQAHLTRDFTAAVGVSPARYARS